MGNFLKSSSQPAKNTSSKARGLHHATNSSERLVDLGGQFSGIKAQRRFTFTEVRRGSEKRKIGLDDFIIMKVLGKGSFGKVGVLPPSPPALAMPRFADDFADIFTPRESPLHLVMSHAGVPRQEKREPAALCTQGTASC